MSAQAQDNLFVLADVKEMNAPTLMKVLKSLAAAIKTVTTELEIKSKESKKSKGTKGAKEPKEPKVKGETPPHLAKNNAWVSYVKEYAHENGWEAFTIHQKDGELEVAASVYRDGIHVHEATGKPMIQKEAMSYAKYLWSAKTGTGAHKEVYDTFEGKYGKAEAKPVKMAIAIPASASASASASVSVPIATPVKAKAPKAPKAPMKKNAVVEWVPPTAGNVKAWTHEGETYLRDNENRLWHPLQGGEVGAWVGVYNQATDSIEEAEEPLYEDE